MERAVIYVLYWYEKEEEICMEAYPGKSYKGFIIWMILFCAAVGIIPFIMERWIPDLSVGLMVRVIDFFCCFSIAILSYMIYKNGRIYWYNKYSYEQAKAMSEDERREIALRPLMVFLKVTLICAVLFIMAQILDLPWWTDFTVFMIILMAAVFRA